MWSDKVNDILAIGRNSNRIRSRKEMTSLNFSVSSFGNLNVSILCSFSLLWYNCSFAEMQCISVLTGEKQKQIPTRFSHCFYANQSLCCVHLFRNERDWAQDSTLSLEESTNSMYELFSKILNGTERRMYDFRQVCSLHVFTC